MLDTAGRANVVVMVVWWFEVHEQLNLVDPV